MPDPLKVAIIGAGAVTQVAYLPVLRKVKDVEVLAICDPDVPKARALAERYGVRDAFSDIQEVVEFEALDALLICSPNHLHENHVLAALAADLHVLAERPLALSAAGVQRVARAAEKRGKLVFTAMNHRYRPDVQLVRGFVQAGELGEVLSVRGSWHLFRPTRQHLGWRQRKEESGGGALLDLGLPLLDLAFWLAGNPTPQRVSASWEAPVRDRGVEQSGSVFVVCEDGPTVFIDVTWHHLGAGERFGMGLRASRGAAAISPLTVWKELHGAPTDVSPTTSGSRENAVMASFRAQWAHFAAAVRGEAAPPALEDQVKLAKLMDAIYRSAQDGRDVTL